MDNSSERRLLRAIESPGEVYVSRQGHGDPSKKGCSCGNSSDAPSYKSKIVLIVVVLSLCGISALATILYRKHLADRPPVLARDEAEKKAEVESQVEMAKAALVTVDSVEDKSHVCCICLEPLSDQALERPPNCDHVMHSACLRRWLETARPPAANQSAEIVRSLQCPVCAKSMLPESC